MAAKSSLECFKANYHFKNILGFGILWALIAVSLMSMDATGKVTKIIPRYYYAIPKKGDSFPVHGVAFGVLVFVAAVLTFVNSYVFTLYSLWKWKVVYRGTDVGTSNTHCCSRGGTWLAIAALETFLTISQAFTLVLAVGHVFYLMAVIFGRVLAAVIVTNQNPHTFGDNGGLSAVAYSPLGRRSSRTV